MQGRRAWGWQLPGTIAETSCSSPCQLRGALNLVSYSHIVPWGAAGAQNQVNLAATLSPGNGICCPFLGLLWSNYVCMPLLALSSSTSELVLSLQSIKLSHFGVRRRFATKFLLSLHLQMLAHLLVLLLVTPKRVSRLHKWQLDGLLLPLCPSISRQHKLSLLQPRGGASILLWVGSSTRLSDLLHRFDCHLCILPKSHTVADSGRL